jgi:predicted GNAT family acetyltransferase
MLEDSETGGKLEEEFALRHVRKNGCQIGTRCVFLDLKAIKETTPDLKRTRASFASGI